MELENASIAAELSSSVPTNQVNALLVLLRLYSAGKDIQNYVSTVVQSVLVKSNDPLVRKLCYQLIKGCTINNKYDWDFILKEIVRDISNQQNNDLCVWALRSIVSLCGTGTKFQDFFLKSQRQIEECVFRTSSEAVRITALGLIKVFAKSIHKTNLINSGYNPTSSLSGQQQQQSQVLSSVDLCGNWILKSIEDSNQEVAYTAFTVLRELICGDACVCHFHQEELPITVSVESMKWIKFMSRHYSFLLSRIKCMDARRRYPALRPLTYISLLVKQDLMNNVVTDVAIEHNSVNIGNLIKPMLQSVECATVLEAAHCMLLTLIDSNTSTDLMACTNNFIDEAINAYLSLLNRNESSYSHEDIMKDVCCLLNRVRDKYSICAALIDHVCRVYNEDSRMYIFTNTYRTLLKCSISTKLKQRFLNLTNRVGVPSEIELFSKERIVTHVWMTPATLFEQMLRCEMLFCACREFLLLKPDTSDDETYQAWLDVGVELCDQGKDCLLWDDCPGLNTTISEFGKVLTRLCVETHTRHMFDSNERKNVTKILNQILDMVLAMKTEFAELVSMCILSNYVDSKRVSGKESADVVFDHTKFMLSSTLKGNAVMEKQKVDTLLYCLLWLCLRFSIKLRDTREYLHHVVANRHKVDAVQESLVSALNKVQYALEYGNSTVNNPSEIQTLFGRAFHDDHPIFKSYYTSDDDRVLNNYIRGIQMLNDTNSSLHQEDPYNLKSVMLTPSIVHSLIQLETDQKFTRVKQYSSIVSQPADPLSVTATYVLMPDQYSLILHVKIHNNTSTNAYQVSVEVGVEGSLRLFEQSPQSSQPFGDLPSNSKVEFEREFLIDQFSKCSFFISVNCSHIKKSIGEDMLSTDERKDAGLVTIRCVPFTVNLSHLLYPPKLMSHSDFLTVWETFESSFHKRMQLPRKLGDGPDMIKQIIQSCNSSQTSANIISCFYSIKQPSELVVMREDAQGATMFQQCLCSRTIFGDYIMVVVTGVLHHNQELYVCDWEFRTSTSAVQHVLKEDHSDWFSEMVENASRTFKTDAISVIYDLSKEKIKYDIFCDSNTEDKISVKQEFGLNEAQSTVLFLQKWDSIASRLVISDTPDNLPANISMGSSMTSTQLQFGDSNSDADNWL